MFSGVHSESTWLLIQPGGIHSHHFSPILFPFFARVQCIANIVLLGLDGIDIAGQTKTPQKLHDGDMRILHDSDGIHDNGLFGRVTSHLGSGSSLYKMLQGEELEDSCYAEDVED